MIVRSHLEDKDRKMLHEIQKLGLVMQQLFQLDLEVSKNK